MRNTLVLSSIFISSFISCQKEPLNESRLQLTLENASSKTSGSLKYGSMKDIEGNVYKTIKIGSQVWMAENLKVSRFRNGDLIPNVTKDADWANATTPAWCFINNNSGDGATYGKLYNWYAATDSRGLAPTGWHIPSKTEWEELVNFLGGVEFAGVKMKSTSGWDYKGNKYPNFNGPGINGTNESGFNALPGGYRNDSYGDGTMDGIFYPRNCGNWWSTTMITNDYWPEKSYFFCYMFANSNLVHLTYYFAQSGFSVRCVKD